MKRKQVFKLGTMDETHLTLTPTLSEFLQGRLHDTKMDVVFNLTAVTGSVTLSVEEQLDNSVWYETAVSTAQTSVDMVGLANENFPMLGKLNLCRFAAAISEGTTFAADVYAITYEN